MIPDLVEVFVKPLEQLGAPYMVTGGVASVIYGDPRFTRDIDIVLALPPEDAQRFAAAFDSDVFYVPPLETLRTEAGRPGGGHFNLVHRDSSLRADIYVLSQDPLHSWGFEHRRALQLERTRLSVAPPEYVIVRKLQYYRSGASDRHLRDIAAMLRISEGQIDLSQVGRLAEGAGVSEEWKEVQRFRAE